ncbi:TPA: fimbrial protein [Citrobacter farmeri]|uniref:fimbrial protein n=1 Tax=Citrobacter farmeri TaxID=67824 RepID=UPI002AB5731B|nr:type 1 fimbrial protein [Citrobacter farmeri]HEM6741802.1 type 1 fimbrial protein [Citrobacter farmeri]
MDDSLTVFPNKQALFKASITYISGIKYFMNVNSRLLKFAAGVAVILSVSQVNAAITNNDGTVNFTGEIIDASCTVDIGANNTMEVILGKVSKTVFTGVGSYASSTEFDLKVKDCPATIHGIAVKFDGQGYNGDNSVLAVTAGTGTAEGVAIELLDKNQKVVPLFTVSDIYPLADGETTLTLPFYARYKQVAATVKPGPANSTAQFTLNYN